jgi:hypothetical protein
MPSTHKVLFGASIMMFIISLVVLGLIVQENTVEIVPIGNGQAQIILAMFQVRIRIFLLAATTSADRSAQYVTGDLVIIWRCALLSRY